MSVRETKLEEKMRRNKIAYGFSSRPQSPFVDEENIYPNFKTSKSSMNINEKDRSTFGDFSFTSNSHQPRRSVVSSSSTRYVESPYDPYTVKTGSLGEIVKENKGGIFNDTGKGGIFDSTGKGGVFGTGTGKERLYSTGTGNGTGSFKGNNGGHRRSRVDVDVGAIESIDIDDFPEFEGTRPMMKR